jgi:hypothetical protein
VKKTFRLLRIIRLISGSGTRDSTRRKSAKKTSEVARSPSVLMDVQLQFWPSVMATRNATMPAENVPAPK